MSVSVNVDAIISDFYAKCQLVGERILKLMDEETHKAVEEAYREFGDYQSQKIRQIFTDAVDRFYSAYHPMLYERTGSLYDVLNLRKNSEGMAILDPPHFDRLFDPSAMSPFLYETVFKEGWHGGAKSIASGKADVWGAHPSPGTPYYRRGGWVKYPNSSKKKWHRYGKWGRVAKHSKAPYVMISDELQDTMGGEMFSVFKELVHKHNEDAMEIVRSRIPSIQAEVFR